MRLTSVEKAKGKSYKKTENKLWTQINTDDKN